MIYHLLYGPYSARSYVICISICTTDLCWWNSRLPHVRAAQMSPLRKNSVVISRAVPTTDEKTAWLPTSFWLLKLSPVLSGSLDLLDLMIFSCLAMFTADFLLIFAIISRSKFDS